MLLIDAVYINSGGGKILLDYLIEQLEDTNLDVFYLLDKRIKLNHPKIKTKNQVQYLSGGLIPKRRFYIEKGHLFKKVFCFGNFPPGIRLNCIVYTYFHQLLFIRPTSELSFCNRILLKLKTVIFGYYSSNSDYWIVQSQEVKKSLCQQYKRIYMDTVLVAPFYPKLDVDIDIMRRRNHFLYVSSGHSYKNHERLLKAFLLFFDKYKIGELHLTIGPEFEELYAQIIRLTKSGYPITNHGFLDRRNLSVLYRSVEFVVYPSTAESFGLGIVEAIENGCKIIGSDLPWLYAICNPSMVFDPKSVESINDAFKKATSENIPFSKQIEFDQVERLVNLLK